jgi:hypothetical protein
LCGWVIPPRRFEEFLLVNTRTYNPEDEVGMFVETSKGNYSYTRHNNPEDHAP